MFGICMHIKTNKINKQTNKMCYQCVCITSVLILAYVQPSGTTCSWNSLYNMTWNEKKRHCLSNPFYLYGFLIYPFYVTFFKQISLSGHFSAVGFRSSPPQPALSSSSFSPPFFTWWLQSRRSRYKDVGSCWTFTGEWGKSNRH